MLRFCRCTDCRRFSSCIIPVENVEGEAGAGAMLPAMECQPFEHHDYIMLMFRNDQDFQQACELLEIKKVQITYPGGLQKVGLGRVIDGAKAIAKLTERGRKDGVS